MSARHDDAIATLNLFQIETPSWGYADTGTRFGKFFQDAAAISLEDKLADAGQVHHFTACCPKVAMHVLWDFVEGQDPADVAAAASQHGVSIGSINANVFQDQHYKLGSFGNPEPGIRRAALDHCMRCAALARATSGVVTLWFADGTNYPGQDSVRERKHRFEENLRAVHDAMPDGGLLLVEYKPFEPAFYFSDIADWGMALLHAQKAGPKAKVLVDTGHHYPSQNIEQIVAWLLDEGMLGGFHFNDRRYADDDLTLGSIDPYQIFRIFHEIHAYAEETGKLPQIEYMVDQSHNLKPKIEAMLQTAMVAQDLWLKAALVDRTQLRHHQQRGEIVDAERLLKKAFNTDVEPMLAEWRRTKGLHADPIVAFRESGYEARVGKERAARRKAAGMSQASSYA